MPVRTRSQRLKEELSSSEEASSSVHKTRASQRNRRQSQKEQKPEEIEAYTANVDEIRKYVKNILDSPNKVDLPSKKKDISSTPINRVDRITINKDQPEQMEFLIPPAIRQTPMEKRQKVRSVLSDGIPPFRVPDKSPSYPPIYNETTKLWTPNAPTYNEEGAERISRLLIMFIFTILVAVFVAYYQQEITLMVRRQLNELNPLLQSLRQEMESLLQSLRQETESLTAYGSTIWSSFWGNNEGNVDNHEPIMDDSVTK